MKRRQGLLHFGRFENLKFENRNFDRNLAKPLSREKPEKCQEALFAPRKPFSFRKENNTVMPNDL